MDDDKEMQNSMIPNNPGTISKNQNQFDKLINYRYITQAMTEYYNHTKRT